MPKPLPPQPSLPVPPHRTPSQAFDLAVSILCDHAETHSSVLGDLYAFTSHIFGVDARELERAVTGIVARTEAARLGDLSKLN